MTVGHYISSARTSLNQWAEEHLGEWATEDVGKLYRTTKLAHPSTPFIAALLTGNTIYAASSATQRHNLPFIVPLALYNVYVILRTGKILRDRVADDVENERWNKLAMAEGSYSTVIEDWMDEHGLSARYDEAVDSLSYFRSK